MTPTVDAEHTLAGGKVLVAGCGFLGLELAQRLHAAGAEVRATTLDAITARELDAALPFPVTPLDLADPEAVAQFAETAPTFDVVFHCASSNRGGAEAYQAVFVEGASHLAATWPRARLIFTSSTSVYAQTDGGWVTEDSPADPTAPTGRLLREAEETVLRAGGIVARLAGLYGPDRWVQLSRLQSGEALLEEGGHRWQNQVHRDDAATALLHLACHGQPGTLYNVTDNDPLTQRQLYTILAKATGHPLPPDGPANPNRKRGITDKRVSNAKLRGLGWEPAYSSVNEALGREGSIPGNLGV